ncbi:MAG TPA: cold-shock protein [Balneolaceae bacterium]|nr:cold-shock protein [Balneolaceae bacterium]
MQYGKIKWFDAQKGYGFIKPDEGKKDVFIHKNNVEGLRFNEGLDDGQEVEFDVEESPKGLSAIEVRRV